MRIDNASTINKTTFTANLLAKIRCKELNDLLPEFQKAAKEIPNTANDIILLAEEECNVGNQVFTQASFDYFQQGNPKSVLSVSKWIAVSKDGKKRFDSDFVDELRISLSVLADRIKRLPVQYQE